MSIKVDLEALGATLGDYAFGYLVTVGDDFQAHAVTVTPTIGDGTVGVGPPGGRTRRNLAHHDGVTLLCPPRDPGGYTLIIDGRARTPTSDDDELLIEPSHAVLHRRAVAPAAPQTDGCGHDCVPLDES